MVQARRARKIRARSVAVVPVAAAAVTGIVLVPLLVAGREQLPTEAVAAAPAGGAAPETLTENGVQLVRVGTKPITGAYIDPADPTALFVYAGEAGPPGSCTDYTVVRVVKLTTDTVTLDASVYKPPDPPTKLACTAIGYSPKRHRLDLGVRLGDRRVVDTDGHPLHVLGAGTLLQLTALLDGYRLPGRLTVGLGDVNEVTVHTYAGPDPQTQIEVYQGVPSKVPGWDEPVPPSVVVDRPTVHGHDAVVTKTAGLNDLTCLRWQESSDVVVSVCSRGNPAPLTSRQLQDIAASLQPTSDLGG